MKVNFIIKGFTTDITTNSSSEIFTGIKHNLDAVTEIVQEIFDWYNDLDEDELEWGKWNDVTMNECLTIAIFNESHFDMISYYRVNTPPYLDTGDWVTKIIDGKKERVYEKYDNAEELEQIYRLKRDQVLQKYVNENQHLLGTVVIESVSDNTIPYDIVEKIEDTFICQRTHLG